MTRALLASAALSAAVVLASSPAPVFGASTAPSESPTPADPGAPALSTFTALTPVRVADSRGGLGLSGSLAPGTPRTFAVAGTHGIPTSATAVTGNLTVVDATARGFVALTPAPVAAPTTSTINTGPGDGRANGVFAALGAGGILSVTAMRMSANIVFDVTGYFSPDPAGSSWYPLVPARILDTRDGIGLTGKFAASAARTFAAAGRGGVPWGAVAVTGNVTVTRQSCRGYLSVTTAPANAPSTSTLNFPLGDTRANNVVAQLSSGGTLSATFRPACQTGTADVVFDVTGYFLRGTGGASFVPVQPVRAMDTRIGLGARGPVPATGAVTVAVVGRNGIPTDAVAITGNLTATDMSASGFATVVPVASAVITSTLNVPARDVRANGFVTSVAPTSTIVVSYHGGSTVQLIADVTGYFVGPRPPAASATFVNASSPAATTVLRSPAAPPVTWQERGTVTNRALSQFVAQAVNGSCSGVSWRPAWTLTASSTSYQPSRYTSGYCYRYSLSLNGDPTTTVTSAPYEYIPFTGMELYRATAWSQQVTMTWCTAASTQMMLNIIKGASDHSASSQSTYFWYAVHHSMYVAQGGGAEIDGWANAVTAYGGGTYRAVAYRTFDDAVKAAATRMRVTGKPVGLVVMEGHHAWVMSGFTSTGGDPALTQDFTVTSVTIMAPLGGGYDPAPGYKASMSYLRAKLTPYTDDFPTIWTGGYAIVQP